MVTYILGEKKEQLFIKCYICGLASFSHKDIEHKYCGFCQMFHEDPTIIKEKIIKTNQEKIWKLHKRQ